MSKRSKIAWAAFLLGCVRAPGDCDQLFRLIATRR
jgi:hypothetical protein